jgi:hypothetical protein
MQGNEQDGAPSDRVIKLLACAMLLVVGLLVYVAEVMARS